MAVDVTKTDNYQALSAGDQTLVDTAVTALKAAFTGGADTDHKGNMYQIFKEIIEQQEET